MDQSVDSLEARWCAVTGGRGFMARHLVMALLRSGGWRVRITDLAPDAALEPTENDGLLGAALRGGRAVYVAADVCELVQLTEGTCYLVLHPRNKVASVPEGANPTIAATFIWAAIQTN
jgi:nucleoside-diphosphate-sugar epimerase